MFFSSVHFCISNISPPSTAAYSDIKQPARKPQTEPETSLSPKARGTIRHASSLGDQATCSGPCWGMGVRAGAGHLEEQRPALLSKGYDHTSPSLTPLKTQR